MGTITNVTKVFDLANNAFGQGYVLAVVKAKIAYLSQVLKRRGYLFLNGAYSEFEFPLTREGQKLGWISTKNDLKIEWHAVENSNAVEVTFMNLCNIMDELPSEEEL